MTRPGISFGRGSTPFCLRCSALEFERDSLLAQLEDLRARSGVGGVADAGADVSRDISGFGPFLPNVHGSSRGRKQAHSSNSS